MESTTQVVNQAFDKVTVLVAGLKERIRKLEVGRIELEQENRKLKEELAKDQTEEKTSSAYDKFPHHRYDRNPFHPEHDS